ncbi:phage integrase central domain-containing protein [Burkholderia plantarii]|uniref:phage integrase central domain-containing protein n=1 Tax=Burkholderia plantarii TaxID=41899 RepID=UPI003F49E11A
MASREDVGAAERRCFLWLDKRPIAEIDAPEILAVLKRIDSRGSRLPYTAFAAKLAESGRFVR